MNKARKILTEIMKLKSSCKITYRLERNLECTTFVARFTDASQLLLKHEMHNVKNGIFLSANLSVNFQL